MSNDYTPSDAVMHISKGPDYTIQFAVPTPHGAAIARIPLSETAKAIETLSRYIAEQTSAMEDELRKWVQSG